MIPKEEARLCVDMEDYYIIKPDLKWWNSKLLEDKLKKEKVFQKILNI